MYFSYRVKFFIILHFFIKLNLTLQAKSICLLRVFLNLRFDQKDKMMVAVVELIWAWLQSIYENNE